jgi:hypothetical protein
LTRYPTCEPEPTFHEPATGAGLPWAGLALALRVVPELRLRGAGVLPSTKWKKT